MELTSSPPSDVLAGSLSLLPPALKKADDRPET